MLNGHVVNYGQHRTRRSFSRIKEILPLPNLTDVQTESYKWFLDEGVKEVFDDILPISDTSGRLTLEYVDYKLQEPKYTVDESRKHDATYSAPMHVTLKLTNHETGEIKTQDVFFGDLPLMTKSGSFIVNGAERVIVSQLVRSPGVYYSGEFDKNGRQIFGTTVIPNRGAWLEFETDAKNISYVRVDRTRKLPLSVLVRALGFGSDSEIKEIFGDSDTLDLTLDKDVHKNPADSRVAEALKDIYDRLRPGEPKTTDSSRSLLVSRFFDPRRYDLAAVGRYKVNKKLSLKNRLLGYTLAETLADPGTGEVLAAKGTVVNNEVMDVLKDYLDRDDFKTVTYTPSDEGVIPEPVTVQEIKVFSREIPDREIKLISNGHIAEDVKCITPADIIASVNYFLELQEGVGNIDDIDHLGNRRIRRVGELLQNQMRIGLARMERVVRERMSIQDAATVTPQQLINIRPIVGSIKEFFGSSQLSQFMDQNNPLGELTHKRRMSALGPGGLSRDRAGYEVRDVHYTHYGRLCPIETPEGPNIGLINSMATYAIINKYGFLETPYRRVSWATHKVTDKIDYLTADEEDNYIIAGANTPLNEDGSFVDDVILCRHREDNVEVSPDRIDYIDVIPKQVVSVTSACIPFLENDDSNRALMGANHQRQAVPLINPHGPLVATGMEYRAGHDSGDALLAEADGEVEYVDANEIRVRREDQTLDTYTLEKYRRSNATKNYNQTPNVKRGDKVVDGQVIANGPSMADGELALGQNPVIAFTTWNMYNFEDAIMLSERLVKEDVYTSIHIEDYDSEARDTKLGPEEITREIPNVGEDALKDLDENGIIRIGAEVHDGDILVGKVTPKGITELSAEERLLHAIFGEKAREVRDTSLRVPHGGGGVVQDVQVFTREAGDELAPGVNTLVRVYIVQKRKIQVGDKMSGRHGNKGTVALIAPVEDMPYLPDGTPVDICLNPMGVPSRMNIGQLLEIHLGRAARALGIHVATPVFDGASEDDVWDFVREAGVDSDGKTVLYDGRTGEPFHNRVSVGVMYYLKLTHMVDDKIHARSIGPYSLVTQQPLGGKAQFGGQRFGEMEVWALEAYGAAYTLQEILTYKSDDVVGRVKAYEAIVKGERITKPGVPESFRVLVKELQSLGLDLRVLDSDENEVELRDMDEDSNEHVNIDALSRLAEAQEKKKLAEEEAEIAAEAEAEGSAEGDAAEADADANEAETADDDKASK
ncbi:DNA-directed RNA polymerase subunit beta [Lactobacillus delbrueckii subsp. bulgaricus]|uniref:DNA-directed RNA polymerase subunit beta n=2 Tax=Lactobacillus delbrueckii subsp. bulgaricus TaxID=1585 RepID=RPOB_LACDA|nr:DNA-directed RNA polymerase subunit beta [Lactobacillus delbrueckii]Q1GBM5.1 RecName: Full=DNA-directed RNA polymerase subunit beta; Short=RNAP subunit beta; AltName: Full=RNA polymerase subunit beta; AltName: Full=Transcriptase subunit beta [Lactobacillus delbrueckii subsp. bulgaricus ATCC 11842 = JCM 1002]MDG9748385.1 DNA-directed RNA polymerase subunit beta [Lactobacillus delbrueckii subsp. bulgaricus ATCC 11842 = JCM 1002]GEB90194.1 DNA-directed RNA polymerase subunit beta [Lactobacillus 